MLFIQLVYSAYESRENLDSITLSITVKNIPSGICKTASKFEKEILKIGPRTQHHSFFRNLPPFLVYIVGVLSLLFHDRFVNNGKKKKKKLSKNFNTPGHPYGTFLIVKYFV